MFWQNRTEALTAKEEKDNTKTVNEEKFEKEQQIVIISSLGEEAVQVINDKKVSSPSKPNASIEEGKAKKGKRKRVPDYKQKVNKLTTARRSEKKQLKL